VSDYPLIDLKGQFLIDLEYYLKTERQLAQRTINKAIQRFRKPIKIAVAEGYLDKDPFMLIKFKGVKTEVVFLSPGELASLEKHEFAQSSLQFVQDLFVFCCCTGLPYNELMNFKHSSTIEGFDDNLWIKMKRMKTSKELSIPLLPKALKILENYNNEDNVFPRISFVESAGLNHHNYNSTKQTVEYVADLLSISRSSLDATIWYYMSSKNIVNHQSTHLKIQF